MQLSELASFAFLDKCLTLGRKSLANELEAVRESFLRTFLRSKKYERDKKKVYLNEMF